MSRLVSLLTLFANLLPRRRGAVAALVGGTALAATPAVAATTQSIDTSTYLHARCNDGSPAVYSYELAPAPTRRWIIHFQGGGQCHSAESCAARWYDDGGVFEDHEVGGHRSMTSQGWSKNSFAGAGILDFDYVTDSAAYINPFSGMNRMFVHYCSSDLWKGRGGWASTAGSEWDQPAGNPYPRPNQDIVFHGADIVDAIIDLVKTGRVESGGGPANLEAAYIPNDSNSEVVITGSSAGSSGVTTNIDRITAELQDGNSHPLVYAVMDSADSVGILADAQLTGSYQAASAAYWEGGGHLIALDASCVSAEGAGSTRCYDVAVTLRNHISTPYFVAENAWDRVVHEPFKEAIMAAQGLTDAQAIFYIRNAITAGSHAIGSSLGTPVGLFIPNYEGSVHQLMADSARFFTHEDNLLTGSPRLRQNGGLSHASFANALGCFRAQRRQLGVAVACQATGGDSRVVNDTANPQP
jgi:hypothetical protein